MQILGLASAVTKIFTFVDTNLFVSPKRKSGVEGLDQCKAPTRNFCIAVEYRLQIYPVFMFYTLPAF